MAPGRPGAILAAPAFPLCQASVSKDCADANRTGTEACVALCQGEGPIRRGSGGGAGRWSTGEPLGPAHAGSHTQPQASSTSRWTYCNAVTMLGCPLGAPPARPQAGVSGSNLGAGLGRRDSSQGQRGGGGWAQCPQAGHRSIRVHCEGLGAGVPSYPSARQADPGKAPHEGKPLRS